MTEPAARQGDPHKCPVDGSSPIVGPCCTTVHIGGRFAARKDDTAVCKSGTDTITGGSATVLIGNKPAARKTERFAHGGTVTDGFPTVLIGNPPVGPDGRATTIPPECAILKNFGSATGKNLARLRDQYFMSPREEVWEPAYGDKTPTHYWKRDVYVRGHRVTVYEPVDGPPTGQWTPSSDNMAKGLATLSDEQLRNVDKVYIVPHAANDDPNAIAEYKERTFRYYPRSKAHDQSDIDWALQHESAHGYWFNELWDKKPEVRDAWQRAIDADHRRVTAYGDSHIKEDFAEFMILYAATKGTGCEAAARALFPNRYREMDKLFPNGMPVRNPAGVGQPY